MKKLFATIIFILLLAGCSNPLQDSSFMRGDASDREEQHSRKQSGDEEDPSDHKGGKEHDGNSHEQGRFLQKGSRYAYQCLSEAEQLWYEDIENCLDTMSEEVELSADGLDAGLGEEDIQKIYTCVFLDHPEFFFTDCEYAYYVSKVGSNVTGISVCPQYLYDWDTAVLRKVEMDGVVREILAGVDPYADDYEKIKYVYETLIERTNYDPNASDNQNVYSVFVGRSSVCQGYAKAMQYLLNELGVECLLVQGSAGGQAHGWNVVKSNGEYYHLDVTWGDIGTLPSDRSGNDGPRPEVQYDYFCVTTEEIELDHSVDNVIPIPICTATEDNYYVRENLVFSHVDEDRLEKLFHDAQKKPYCVVSFKCKNHRCYQEMMEHLLDDDYVHDYYDGLNGQVYYNNNEELRTMTFWVTN